MKSSILNLTLAALFSTTIFFAHQTMALADAKKEKLIITGSSTIAPLILDMAKRFEKENPNVRIDIQTGGSSRGLADVRQAVADIGMVSREIKTEDQVNNYEVALDGICMIVHKDNPIAELTVDQIVDIYTGKITNWKTVGWKDQKITVVHKAEGRSTLEVFLKYFKLENQQIKPHSVIGDNEQGIKLVVGNPYSIAYVSIGTAEYNAHAGSNIRLLPLNSVAASTTHVLNGTYPLSRPLNLVTYGKVRPWAQKFIEYTQSKNVIDLVKSHNFVTAKK